MKVCSISQLKNGIEKILHKNKAKEIEIINLENKSSFADFMIIASGNSSRHIQALSELVLNFIKKNGVENSRIEGRESKEWKLIDGIDVVVHIFHPEKRKFYDLEKMWSELTPQERITL